VDAGFAADMRAVLIAEDLNEVDPIAKIADDVEKVKSYFWQHPLYFHTALGVGLRHVQKYSATVNFNVWIPFAPPKHLEGDISLLGWRFGLGVRFSRYFNRDAPMTKVW
jgi:hypothetical protein